MNASEWGRINDIYNTCFIPAFNDYIIGCKVNNNRVFPGFLAFRIIIKGVYKMKNIYNKINSLFVDSAEKNTALNIADALYYGFTATYEINDCGTTPERYNEIKKQVFDLICGEG